MLAVLFAPRAGRRGAAQGPRVPFGAPLGRVRRRGAAVRRGDGGALGDATAFECAAGWGQAG